MAERAFSDDWWTLDDVAEFLGVEPSTVRSYVVRGQIPEPDHRLGQRMSLWRPSTIRDWASMRRSDARSSAQRRVAD